MNRSMIIGAIAWALTPVMFAAEIVTMLAWPTAYSLSRNTISDLGSTSCGSLLGVQREGVYVCSPQHAWMNAAFVVVGVLTVVGAALLRPLWPDRRLATVGLLAIAASGVGGVLVGLAPSDQRLALHAVGALLQVPGAVGPLLLALTMRPGPRRAYTFATGIVGAAACVLFLSGLHLGLGPGGMERLGFEPLTLWTGVIGALVLASHARTRAVHTV